MSKKEIITAMRRVAQGTEEEKLGEFELVYTFVATMLDMVRAATDHAEFGGVKVEPNMIEAIAGNILINAEVMHTLAEVELMVSGAALMIGVIQLNEYMKERGEL